MKVIKTNADSTAIQTPDGVIINWQGSARCTSPSTRTNLIGCTGSIQFDLNGSDPPTKTTIDTVYLIDEQWEEATCYDTIWIEVDKYGKLHLASNDNITFQDEKRAKKYLGL